MSDSDDTDILLLVPPGIFVESVERDLELNSLQTQVVGSLIDQVSDLENRITFIESVNSSSGNSELKSTYSMVLNDCDTSGEISIVNEDLSSQCLVSPSFVLNTCEINSNTESSLDLNPRESGLSKSKEALLKEIDVYLNNISLKREENGSLTTSESIENGLEKVSGNVMAEDVSIKSPQKRLDLPEVDRLLKEMESTQMEIENKLRMREVEYGLGGQKHSPSQRKSFPPTELSCSPQERNSAPFGYTSPLKIQDLGKSKADDYRIKRDSFLIGSSHNSDSEDTKKNGFSPNDVKLSGSFDSKNRFVSPRRRLFHSENYPIRKPTYGQSSTSIAPYQSEDLQKKDYFSRYAAGDSGVNSFSKITDRRKQNFKSNRTDLLSLAELWRSDKDLTEDDSKKIRQKLEEEKIRRIHLENTIQDLQKRVLEEQEKLAVAIKVDEGKDKAILQITDAWKQMVNHWRDIEADRHAMSQAIIKEKAKIKDKEEEINKKVERWEKEVSQALDLAAGYKNKYELLENELTSTIETNNDKTKDFEKKLKTLEEELQQLYEERKVLTEKLNLTQEEHEKEKQLVEVAQKELSSLQDMLKNTEAELAVVKEQRDLLSTRLREEKGRSTNLEQQKTQLQEELDTARQRLAEAEESVKNATANLEKAKLELKGMYQGQLEAVVKAKVEELQGQLDRAQEAMKAELTETRRLAQERATSQQQALINSHALEIRRMDAMYKEEIRTLESKLLESERRREKLESGKKEIAHKLHGVMEAQWQQALSIITSEVSLRQGDGEPNKKEIQESKENRVAKIDSVEADSSFDETPYIKEVEGTSRHQPNGQDLLKYIQMLLDKQPGKPIDSGSSGVWPEATQSDTFEESLGEHKWNQIISNNGGLSTRLVQDKLKPYPPSQRKPPWK